MQTTATTQSNTPGVLGLIGAVVGFALMAWGFMAGIDAALSGSGSGPGVYVWIFFGGAAVVLAALVLAFYHLARHRLRVLSWVTIVLCAIPGIAIILLVIVNQ